MGLFLKIYRTSTNLPEWHPPSPLPLENVAFLRAQNGGGQARLLFSLESLGREKINTRTSVNRVVGLDIAEQSISLAKETILVNISAAILAQANASSDIALMLLR